MADPGRKTITGRIYANLGKLLGGKVAAGVISLVYMGIAARTLGPRDYGVLILVHTFAVTVGTVVGFPGWHAVVRFGAQAIAVDARERLLRLLRFTAVVEALGGIVAVIVAAVLGVLLGALFGWSATAIAFAVPYSFAVLGAMRSTPAGFLQLVRRYDLLGAHNVVAPLVRLIGAVIAAAIGSGLHGFLVVWLIAALAEWLAMWAMAVIVARFRLPGHRLLGSPRGAVAENAGIWRFMLAANADVTFGELAPRLLPLAVGWLMGPVAAGFFAVAQRATVIITQPAQILGRAAYAELAALVAAGGDGRSLRQAVVRCVGLAAPAALAVFAIIFLFGREIASLMAGASFAAAGGLMVWLAAAQAILLVKPPASAALVALGRPGRSVAANLASGLGLLPLLPLLIPPFGLIGAGIQSVIQATAAAVMLIWFVWQESEKGIRPGLRTPA